MMNRLIVLFLFLSSFFICSAQTEYPKDYFRTPLDIPLILSGTFGELRSNHFHSGLDIKTQKRVGFKIYASAEGYVSRIKISHWGYGKALYITHPNGYTTVYAHLNKFSPTIEEYIKKRQYKAQSYVIELFPEPSELKVKKGEIVAYSGNSGSSGGPHLHYEIRDRNAKPINPMHFGITVKDSKKPLIRAAVAYSFGEESQVNNSNKPVNVLFKRQKNGNLLATPVKAFGKIGFGVNAVDKQDGALNNNGIYDLKMKVNGETVYNHTVSTFSFNETRYINNLIDYHRYYKKRQRIQKCFVEPANKLSIYKNLKNKGFINVEDGKDYSVEITATDFKGNISKLIIPVKGKKDTLKIKKTPTITPYYFKRDKENMVSNGKVTATFSKNTFYDDFFFNFKQKKDVAILHNGSVPLHKRFTLSFDVSDYPAEEQKKLFIGRINSKNRPIYSSTKHSKNKLTTRSKNLGNYGVFSDNQAPKIKPINFKPNQHLNKYRYLKVRISDNLSGIKHYRGEIDGKWILMEFDAKRALLTYDFNNAPLTGNKHTFKLVVSDNMGNTNTYSTTFYKK